MAHAVFHVNLIGLVASMVAPEAGEVQRSPAPRLQARYLVGFEKNTKEKPTGLTLDVVVGCSEETDTAKGGGHVGDQVKSGVGQRMDKVGSLECRQQLIRQGSGVV